MNRLPRIAADVPARLIPSTNRRANAQLAIFLYRAGVLRHASLPERWDDPLEVCRAALRGWLRRWMGPLHCLRPSFGLELMPWGPDGQSCAVVTWWQDNADVWQVGTALERLERFAPGLGATALDAFVRQCSYPMFTPMDALDEAGHLFWQGEDDERPVLAECCDNDEERNEMAASMVKRADFDEAFSAWVLDAKATRLDLIALERLCAVGGENGAVARQLLRIGRLAREIDAGRRAIYSPPGSRSPHCAPDDPYEEYEDDPGMFLGYGARLQWQEDDVTERVYDEVDHFAMQGDAHDWMGRVPFPLDQPCRLRGWMRAMRPHLAMIGLLDGLLALLTA